MKKSKKSAGGASCRVHQSPIFGNSLEIDIVPNKSCPFDCIYCSQDATKRKIIDPIEYVPIANIIHDLGQSLRSYPDPEYLVLSGTGDPSLYKGMMPLVREIRSLTEVPIAVASSGGVLWRHDVQQNLSHVDVILAKLDAGDMTIYHYINRPIDTVPFKRYLKGLLDFSRTFKGRFWLQVTLLNGINALEAEIGKLATITARIKVDKIFVCTDSFLLAKEMVPPLKNEELREFARYFGNNAVVIEQKADEKSA